MSIHMTGIEVSILLFLYTTKLKLLIRMKAFQICDEIVSYVISTETFALY